MVEIDDVPSRTTINLNLLHVVLWVLLVINLGIAGFAFRSVASQLAYKQQACAATEKTRMSNEAFWLKRIQVEQTAASHDLLMKNDWQALSQIDADHVKALTASINEGCL